LPKGITGKVQRTRLSESVSGDSTPPDAGSRAQFIQYWSKLKQLATFKTPRRISIGGRFPKRVTGQMQRTPLSDNVSEESVLSEARLHAELLQIWKGILKVDNLCIDDDFFEKGGNSLLAMDLHVEIQQLTAKSLPESFLSEAATIRGLAKALAS
jgi:oxalate---CoA ligase